MSRLKYAKHMLFDQIPAFKYAVAHTPPQDLKGWEKACEGQRIATQAFVFWVWMLCNYQLEEPGRFNFVYIEWRFRNLKLPWPYGTLTIPLAVLGQTTLNRGRLNLNYKNATI